MNTNRNGIPLMYKGFLFKADNKGMIYPTNLSTGTQIAVNTTPSNVKFVKELIDNLKN